VRIKPVQKEVVLPVNFGSPENCRRQYFCTSKIFNEVQLSCPSENFSFQLPMRSKRPCEEFSTGGVCLRRLLPKNPPEHLRLKIFEFLPQSCHKRNAEIATNKTTI
jgi:hypothetical protein